jgi:hypothetical protein
MPIDVNGNIISGTSFNTTGDILNEPSIVTDGLVLWLDAGNLASYLDSSDYYDCGYGCQYYASDPGCTACNTQWKDMSGYANDWSVVGTYNTLYINYSGQSSSLTPPVEWQSEVDCTIDVWFYPPSGGIKTSCCDTIFGRYDFRFFMINTSIYLMIGFDNGGARIYQHPSYSISYNNWHHIVGMRRDYSDYIFWIDGVEMYNSTYGTGLDLWSTTETWYIAAGGHSSVNISSARIYNRGLSDNEIIQNFNNGRLRFGI